jgi:sec-independent protein translocase protein TatC
MLKFLFGKPDAPAGETSFLGHVAVLRRHLMRSALVIFALMFVGFFDNEIFGVDLIFDKILFGPKRPDFPTYTALCDVSQQLGMGDMLCFHDFDIKLINLTMTGQFTLDMWAAFIAGLVVGFPYLLWELWRFVKPALKANEIKSARGFIFYASMLFFMGVGFGYYIVCPMAIYFLMNYQASAQIVNTIDIDSYIDLITMMVLVMGLVFELPIIIYFLSRFGVVTAEFMRRHRKHALIVILIAAAIITPTTDIFTQMLVAFPLWLLFEVSVLVARRVEKRRVAEGL